MTIEARQTDAILDVLINREEQYSIWPTGKAIPLRWIPWEKDGQKTPVWNILKKIGQTCAHFR